MTNPSSEVVWFSMYEWVRSENKREEHLLILKLEQQKLEQQQITVN